MTNLLWFRGHDLRVFDNKALNQAIKLQEPLICLYIHDDKEFTTNSSGQKIHNSWAIGQASKWWLHQALADLKLTLSQLGNDLVIRQGNCQDILTEFVEIYKVNQIFFHNRFEPFYRLQTETIKRHLLNKGVKVNIENSSLLYPIETIKNQEGNIYSTFTSFFKHTFNNYTPAYCLPTPKLIPKSNYLINSTPLEDLKLEPRINWTNGFRESFTPTQAGGLKLLKTFLETKVSNYSVARNFPSQDGISKLSPYLHFGQISINYIFYQVLALKEEFACDKDFSQNAQIYINELGWREFAYYNMWHKPHTTDEPLRAEFKNFPWEGNETFLKAWQKGQTGYPIVDAGMRELWHTGFMHNRVRMIVASFLCKDLFINWLDGAKWFWDTLVDADLASNTLGWQWTAGCGVDAQPYFRIFNPVLQSQKFDPSGIYIRKWLPELNSVSPSYIHQPWLETLIKINYPKPILDHNLARLKALQTWKGLRKS